ncbi:MAG: glycosyltransferase family 9 protein [Vicingaceae bacterium]
MEKELKILIVRFSSIGDIVLTTPVIRCLKQHFKDKVRLDYLTKKPFETVLAENPYLHKIYTIQNHVDEVVETLKKQSYDVIIDLHKNIRSKSVIKKLGVKAYSFNKLNKEKFLLTTFKINKLPNIHIVDRYLESVQPLGVTKDNKGLDFFIHPENEMDLNADYPFLKDGFIVYAIGGQHATKRLPNDKIIELCNKTTKPIILIGGKTDEENARQIVKESSNQRVVNLCGKLNIQQSASVVKQAQLLITHDSGMMHIGAALKQKIISIWGNTVPDFGMYPYQTDYKIIEVKGLKCRPCSKIGYERCPKKHFKCMRMIDVDAIVSAL